MKSINRNEMIAVTVGILVVAIILLVGVINTMFNQSQPETAIQNTTMENVGGLIVEDVVLGDGEEAVPGKVITAHYTGTLLDGTKFDSSRDRGVPFSFVLGAGQVIKGWDMGIQGMKVGGKRNLTIPAELAYGARAIGSIPANSTLLFEVELLGVSDLQ